VSEARPESTLSVVKSRPAETSALAASIVVLISYFAGVDDPAVIASLTVIVGAIPGVVTWLVVLRRGK
jgi:hypothetical protein